jgi:hypothetical protein
MIVVLVSCKQLGFILAVALSQIPGESLPVSQNMAWPLVPLSGFHDRQIVSQLSGSASVYHKIQVISLVTNYVPY